MNQLEREERAQLAEELASRGVCLADARHWYEVGMTPGRAKPRLRRRANTTCHKPRTSFLNNKQYEVMFSHGSG